MRLSEVMIGSENPNKLGEFYEKTFGKAGWKDDNWFGFAVGGGSLMVGPHSEVEGMSEEPARIMISVESDDLKADFEKFSSLGATVIAEPYQPSETDNPNVWLATLSDPDGNYIQLSTPWEE
jgi:predicted enzyme related to lactoylglutathione lyase